MSAGGASINILSHLSWKQKLELNCFKHRQYDFCLSYFTLHSGVGILTQKHYKQQQNLIDHLKSGKTHFLVLSVSGHFLRAGGPLSGVATLTLSTVWKYSAEKNMEPQGRAWGGPSLGRQSLLGNLKAHTNTLGIQSCSPWSWTKNALRI